MTTFKKDINAAHWERGWRKHWGLPGGTRQVRELFTHTSTRSGWEGEELERVT